MAAAARAVVLLNPNARALQGDDVGYVVHRASSTVAGGMRAACHCRSRWLVVMTMAAAARAVVLLNPNAQALQGDDVGYVVHRASSTVAGGMHAACHCRSRWLVVMTTTAAARAVVPLNPNARAFQGDDMGYVVHRASSTVAGGMHAACHCRSRWLVVMTTAAAARAVVPLNPNARAHRGDDVGYVGGRVV